jgi:hypothetical protein
MDVWVWAAIAGGMWHWVIQRQQQVRIRLLAGHITPLHIDKLMQELMEGHHRALGESDTQRAQQVWALLGPKALALCGQFDRFAEAFARSPAERCRVQRWPLPVPYAENWAPTFDARKLFQLHAQGLRAAVVGDTYGKHTAYTLTAEMLLMQHSCHWYCRSHTRASARLVAQHQTTYAQVLASVTPVTREAYRQLTGR